MELLPTTTTIAISNSTEANEEERRWGRGSEGGGGGKAKGVDARRKGKEYCKLLLPLVFLLGKHWIVCLLPRRTRYCATYSRIYLPAARVFLHSTSRLLHLFLFVFSLRLSRSSPATQQHRCCSRLAIALLSGCDCSGMSREVRSIRNERASWTAIALAGLSLLYSISQLTLLHGRLHLSIIMEIYDD